MKNFEELHLNRCNVQVEDEVKSWYVYTAKSMGMSTSQLMSFVLSQWYEQHINADAVRVIAEMNKNGELTQVTQELFQLIAEFQQVLDEAKEEEENEQKEVTKISKIGKSGSKK